MRIVIVGGREIGFALAQALADQHEVFVVDHAPRIADRFERLDVQFVLGAGTSADVLARAGIESADVLVACTGLEAGSALVGRQIADLHLPHGSLIVAVRRGDSLFIPRGSSELDADDKAGFMGTPEALQEVRLRVGGTAESRRQRVTIVGGGDVGFQLAQRLDAGEPLEVTVIERDVARGEMIAGRRTRALVLNGDGTDLDLLETEDIGRSDADDWR